MVSHKRPRPVAQSDVYQLGSDLGRHYRLGIDVSGSGQGFCQYEDTTCVFISIRAERFAEEVKDGVAVSGVGSES